MKDLFAAARWSFAPVATGAGAKGCGGLPQPGAFGQPETAEIEGTCPKNRRIPADIPLEVPKWRKSAIFLGAPVVYLQKVSH
ncbi:hypothetical protein [Cognatishimia sp. F0-27]|uniref:hypothetical protein n=1 Tax=Cognatishimia sp. F0-27 TaxID=2816855 RepID=UPI001D0C59E4|nr:hypothetical protein [Cognatishimia sp. F0-27]MCC1494260.1 hypothetical protein [Cognatishimia sp. F0-27]